MLYEELLNSCKSQFDDFFKNIELFENQFTWSEFNNKCYDLMFTQNSPDNIFTVKELKEKICELKDTCKKCGNYYMPARNKSIPKYDVIMGKQHEDALMNFLEYKLGAKNERADLGNRSMPDCKILNSDGSVAAYYEVKFHGAPFIMALAKTGRYCYEGSATLDYKKIEKQLNIIEDNLDAPLYYIHWIDYPCLKGVFYETAEQVKNYISSEKATFEREKRDGDDLKAKKSVYLKKMYSPLLEMGSFESFIEEVKSLLK
ncbi:hypothetical protein [Ruminococcus intestinalis]|uniref:hypothetical protein n=1 Tax=Ruminococcus intestinalis TaxID=2763066 RepID=UPI003F7E8057